MSVPGRNRVWLRIPRCLALCAFPAPRGFGACLYREGAARGLAYVRSVEEALEVYFLSRLPPPMTEALEQDIKDLKLSRENYFYSLLDARYRELIAREARHGGPKGEGRKK